MTCVSSVLDHIKTFSTCIGGLIDAWQHRHRLSGETEDRACSARTREPNDFSVERKAEKRLGSLGCLTMLQTHKIFYQGLVMSYDYNIIVFLDFDCGLSHPAPANKAKHWKMLPLVFFTCWGPDGNSSALWVWESPKWGMLCSEESVTSLRQTVKRFGTTSAWADV